MECRIVDFGGIKAHCRPDSADEDIGRSVIAEDEYAIRKFANAGGVFVDIGAYCGHASLLAIQCGMTAIAIEPLPINTEAIHENAKLNGVAIQVIEGAIGFDYVFWNDQSSDFNTRHRFVGNRVARHEGQSDCPGISVPARRIDLDVELKMVPRICLLKTDCEGGEWYLPQAKNTLAKTQYIVGEFHSSEFGDFARFSAMFPQFDDISVCHGELVAPLRIFTFENRNLYV